MTNERGLGVIMCNRWGRQVVRELLDRLDWGRSSYASDPLVMAASAGRQGAAEDLVRQIKDQYHDEYLLMLTEEHERLAQLRAEAKESNA